MKYKGAKVFKVALASSTLLIAVLLPLAFSGSAGATGLPTCTISGLSGGNTGYDAGPLVWTMTCSNITGAQVQTDFDYDGMDAIVQVASSDYLAGGTGYPPAYVALPASFTVSSTYGNPAATVGDDTPYVREVSAFAIGAFAPTPDNSVQQVDTSGTYDSCALAGTDCGSVVLASGAYLPASQLGSFAGSFGSLAGTAILLIAVGFVGLGLIFWAVCYSFGFLGMGRVKT